MNITEIESQLKDLVEQRFDPATFVYQLLEIYDAPKATVTKLRQGSANHAAKSRDLLRENSLYDTLWKNKLFFRVSAPGQAATAVDAMAADPLTKKHNPRFLLATDGAEAYCLDTKLEQSLDTAFDKLNDGFMFLLPLAGVERYEAVTENPADIKATGRLAKLYDAILAANPGWASHDHTHELNLLMTRLLFCFFAERTSIFATGLFTSTGLTLTRDDGSDTASVLQTLFAAMNTPPDGRAALPEYARKFPYVNGGLFAAQTPIPTFSKSARRLLKECGDLSWHEINPDIFGSMIQAVVEPDMRGDMGMHYTSVPNIMKVLQPLFLLSLEEELAAAWDSEAKLRKLLDRLYRIRVFDPACGSGNFLIIAYRELRRLENKIFARLNEVAREPKLPMTGIKLNHFFGIELADFACETAKLSMWIAEYQMNEQFKATFGVAPPALPLRDSGNIIHDNSTRRNWLSVCPRGDGFEIYVVGNPPYAGSVYQNNEQKDDMALIFADILNAYKDLDYVATWYLKGADYCRQTGAQCAFVATNSICQGEQVAMLWPLIYQRGMEIGFAHQSFKWRNNAANNAGVTCVIVGIRNKQKLPKILYSGDIARAASNIGPYLIEMDDLVVTKRTSPLSNRPAMVKGNQPSDDGNLILLPKERDLLLKAHPEANKFVRRFYGSQEFIKGIERWCLWIEDNDLAEAMDIPLIAEKINCVYSFRVDGQSKQSRDNATTPHRFAYAPHVNAPALLVPRVASERRLYIPVGVVPPDVIISDNAYAVYNAPDFLISILSSRLHILWLMTIGGQLETRVRYSNTLVYNTFPIPDLSDEQKGLLEDHAVAILCAREAHPGKTIAWLYDPETMPAELFQAHRELDDALERIYLGRAFRNDSERLETLFKLYALKTKKEANAPAKKTLANQGAA